MNKSLNEENPILSARNIKWGDIKKNILDIPQFHINKGEVTALIGPNGAGKSSLLKILALLQKPNSGDIFYKGSPIEGNPLIYRRKMAVIFQEPLLLSGTVYSNVRQGLLFRGLKKNETDSIIKYWLECFNISHLINRSHKHLSGGEAQRVSLARALAVEPEILYLDEPFASLDQPTRFSLLEDMGPIIKERGISVVFVTHHAEELSFFTDRVCVMDKGSIIQEGSPDEIFNKPSNDVTASLVGAENMLEGTTGENADDVCKNSFVVYVDRVPLYISTKLFDSFTGGIHSGRKVRLYIRPENILINGSGTGNKISGIIEKTMTLDSQYKIIVNCGFRLIVLTGRGLHRPDELKPGSKVELFIPPEKIHVVER